MEEKKLEQIEQSNETANTNSSIQEIWNSIKENLGDVIETKKVEKLYHVNLERWNPNHGIIGYIDIVAATHGTAFPKNYSWDYDYDVRLSVKVELKDNNKVKLTCRDKSIILDLWYFLWKPETIEEEHINKILNVLWYEI